MMEIFPKPTKKSIGISNFGAILFNYLILFNILIALIFGLISGIATGTDVRRQLNVTKCQLLSCFERIANEKDIRNI